MKHIERLFKALADKNRIRILALLAEKECCVCELSFVLGITQPSVSRHLKKMKRAELINNKKDGVWTNYYIQKKSGYMRIVLEELDSWIKNDISIRADRKKLKAAKRTQLC